MEILLWAGAGVLVTRGALRWARGRCEGALAAFALEEDHRRLGRRIERPLIEDRRIEDRQIDGAASSRAGQGR